MKDQNTQILLAKVMEWTDPEAVLQYIPKLLLLAGYKYDHYQRFAPGKRFIESLALWLNQFKENDRHAALKLVMDHLVFISDSEFSHLVQMAYPDVIVQERIRLIAEEKGVPEHNVGKLIGDQSFKELKFKSLYLGLSDGARTSELRRASDGEINNEQIWQAYELSQDKISDMVDGLEGLLKKTDLKYDNAKFNIIWLLDDFSGSGKSYIRYDSKDNKWKGKIKKIYERINQGDLVDTSHYEIFLLLYVATRQAIDHIEYWSERFTSEYNYKPLTVKVLNTLEHELRLSDNSDESIQRLITYEKYYDKRASDKHMEVGGTTDARWGFSGCALPLVLSHNTPNNSVYVLWGPETYDTFGLFPRVSRHREY
jgi:hypothetical protein